VTADIAILAPVLGRPQNATPLVESIAESAAVDWHLVFLASPDDYDEIEACFRAAREIAPDRVHVTVVTWAAGAGDYARKINHGYRVTAAPYVLCAADDLLFHPGWDTALLEAAERFDVGVVGTNDLGNQRTVNGTHSTHPLVARCYIDRLGGHVGHPGSVYFEGYDHQWVDTELVATAQTRGCYAHCAGAIVEHRHPMWGKAQSDATYRKGLARGDDDRRLFESRRMLWLNEQVPA
jgi:glycosyl transferase family 2